MSNNAWQMFYNKPRTLAGIIAEGGDPSCEEVKDDYDRVYYVLDYDSNSGLILVSPIDAEEDESGTLPGHWGDPDNYSLV